MRMKKKIRTKGKIQLNKYFQKLKTGDIIAIVKEPSVASNFPPRLQGRTGVVEGRRGKAYMVAIKDQNQEKKFLVEPIHLKKLKPLKEQ